VCARAVQKTIATRIVVVIVIDSIARGCNGCLLRRRRRLELIELGSLFLSDLPCIFDLAAQQGNMCAGLVEVSGATRIARIELAQRNGKGARAVGVTSSRELRAVGCRMK
jgi:hypothetical protein